jgi:signal transduction histidine kinase
MRSQGLAHALEFTGLRLGDSRLEFRYRLDGEEWVSLGRSRLLHLNGLSAGAHTVQVSARDEGRRWGPPAAWKLSQPPRWYETLWARGLLVLAAAALLHSLYRWRLYLERSRHRAVLAERNRIAQEWHDTLLAGFSAISWQLDTALERLRSKSESAAGVLEVAQKMLGHYKVEARRVIADLRQQQDGPVGLVTALPASIRDITAGHALETSFEVIGDPVPLPGDLAQNVLRICQEATSNAVHHARPTRIAVRLEFGPARLTASVRDNGAGFDPTRIPAGRFGLAIMKERARRFGGELRVESRPDEGTLVVAGIPLAVNHG